MNGKTKIYFTVMGLLWTGMVSVVGFSIGDATQASALQNHIAQPSHPVMIERVTGLERDILARLQSIDTRLARLESRDR